MNNIPDFVMQIQEVERQLDSQFTITADDWKDDVQKRYYKDYVDKYKELIDRYINGDDFGNMSGKGLNDLLIFMNEKMQKMEEVTGMSADFTFDYAAASIHKGGVVRDNYGAAIDVENNEEVLLRGGIVHDENRERDYWKEEGGDIMNPDNGTRPGQYSNEEIKQIMEYRAQEDQYKEMYKN